MLRRAAKKRWWLRSAFAALVALPIPAALAHGCGTPTEYDDLCGWLRDPNNCYRDFFLDVGVTCGAVGQTKLGQFATREKLDLCVLNEGGQVVFEPALDLANPPPDNLEPIAIKMINPDTTLCGQITFTAKYEFSVDIEGDALPADAGDAALPEEFLVGGKFEMVGGKETDTLAVTCPNKSEYNFNRLQITRCTEYEEILPHAEIDFSPGGIEQTGVIRINVFYPPQEGPLEDAAPTPINYVECIIPAAPPLCENGIKDGSETDVDCGGSFCSARCLDSQLCITNDDCASMNCGLNMGIRMCAGP